MISEEALSLSAEQLSKEDIRKIVTNIFRDLYQAVTLLPVRMRESAIERLALLSEWFSPEMIIRRWIPSIAVIIVLLYLCLGLRPTVDLVGNYVPTGTPGPTATMTPESTATATATATPDYQFETALQYELQGNNIEKFAILVAPGAEEHIQTNEGLIRVRFEGYYDTPQGNISQTPTDTVLIKIYRDYAVSPFWLTKGGVNATNSSTSDTVIILIWNPDIEFPEVMYGSRRS